MIYLYYACIILLQLLIPECEIVLQRVEPSATAVSINPNLIEVTVFGGCPFYDPFKYDNDQLLLAETAVLKFGRPPIVVMACICVTPQLFFQN